MIQQRNQAINQRGMVSIIVTMVMMLVISIIVLGFAQVSRREARQSLDRQLSQQAFFAAESGVNDARSVIYQNLADGNVEKNSCQTSPSDPNYPFNPNLDDSGDTAYTCLLVTTKLRNLHISPLTAGGDSVVLPVQPTSTTPIYRLHINWRPLSGPQTPAHIMANCANASVPTSGAFPSAGSWNCDYGTLRVDLVTTDDLSRAALQASQKTFILYPSYGAAGKQDYNSADSAIPLMKCTAATGCDIDIQNMPAVPTNYAIRISSLYVSGSVDITAYDSASQPLLLKNAQVQIDVTGKAQDVLRRIQVRLPVAPSGSIPQYALESASSVCKRFRANDTYFEIPGDIAGQDQSNPTCKAVSN